MLSSKADQAAAFETTVFPAELEEIQLRRALHGQAPVVGPARPSAALGLTGLALSGGGIRSAAFSLGVVQAIAERGQLARVDYLSTVSGGGYLGAALSHLLNVPSPSATSPEQFPLGMGYGTVEPPALRLLRNSSNYLRAGGAFDALAMPAVYLRGLVLTAASWLPALLLGVFVTSLVYEVLLPGLDHLGLPIHSGPSLYPFLVCATGLGLLIVADPFLRDHSTPLPRREAVEHRIRVAFGLTVLSILVLPPWALVEFAVSHTPAQVGRLSDEALANASGFAADEHVLVGGTIALTLGMGLLAVGTRIGRLALRALGMLSVGLVAPAVVFAGYLYFCVTEVGAHAVYGASPTLVEGLPMSPPGEGETTEVPAALRETLFDDLLLPRSDLPLYAAPAMRFLWDSGETRAWNVLQDGPSGRERVAFVAQHGDTLSVRIPGPFFGRGGVILVMTMVLVLLINTRFLNVNLISPHGYYRDRLSRVFLWDGAGPGKDGDRVKLSELGGGADPRGSAAPYHLINATLNLNSSADAGLRGRQGDFFLLSKRFVGSEHTGWCPTPEVERLDPALNLGTAMAISGGVANPAMGSMTSGSLTSLMTLLNLRMGYWLPNPRRVLAGRTGGGLRAAPGPSYLAREAFRLLDAEHAYVNASDGGHIENLGIYELLRRRCAVIIAVDGEEDPELTLGSLSTALRYARIDLGIEVEIDLAGIRGAGAGSTAHHATGRIYYSEGEEGTLVYIKASLTGDEGLTIRTYAAQSRAFPHESTADQFFGEEQFEAYRALGEHIARGVENLGLRGPSGEPTPAS